MWRRFAHMGRGSTVLHVPFVQGTFNWKEIEMKKQLWFFAMLAALVFPAVSSAQKLERTKNWEVGDKLTYTYVLKGQFLHAVEEVIQVTDSEVRSTQTIGNRKYEAAYSTSDMSRMKGICIANSEACQFSPAERWVNFPLEKGKTWSNTMAVEGETFLSETTQQRKVEGVEKIKAQVGTFEAYRVSSSGLIKSRGKSGEGPWQGTESATYWWATIKGKLVLVKQEYENSFGARSSRELVAADLK
jgi:hypothetical protein